MLNLLVLLELVSLICLVIGLVRPKMFHLPNRDMTRKRICAIFGGAALVFFILIGITTDSQPKPQAIVTNTTPAVENTVETKPIQKSDQQLLGEKVAAIVTDIGATDMSYRDLQVSKSDPDRPKDTKMITVSVNVKSFYSKNSFIRDTGELTSALFKAVYNFPNIKAYDVLVWYYAETTDRYGNKKDDVVLVYGIDKVTYNKINWQNFEDSDLCDFLKKEDKIAKTFDTACNELVNIK